MTECHPIINVTPINASSERATAAAEAKNTATICNSSADQESQDVRLWAGIILMILGGLLMLAGVVMLIFPGPGLIALILGFFVFSTGLQRVRPKKQGNRKRKF